MDMNWLPKIPGNIAVSGAGIEFLRAQITNLEHRCTVLRARSAILLPKKPIEKEPAIKLRALPPKKDAQAGRASYSNNPSLFIPPPGFISSPNNRGPHRHR
jgi:hypothetical protein